MKCSRPGVWENAGWGSRLLLKASWRRATSMDGCKAGSCWKCWKSCLLASLPSAQVSFIRWRLQDVVSTLLPKESGLMHTKKVNPCKQMHIAFFLPAYQNQLFLHCTAMTKHRCTRGARYQPSKRLLAQKCHGIGSPFVPDEGGRHRRQEKHTQGGRSFCHAGAAIHKS